MPALARHWKTCPEKAAREDLIATYSFPQSRRLESIGRYSAGLCHDLSNILGPILNASQLLKRDISEAEKERLIGAIENTARRGTDILGQLLAFARDLPMHHGWVNIRSLVEEVAELVRLSQGTHIALEVTGPVDADWQILGDASQLHQALVNLAKNACDAMLLGGRLKLSWERLSLPLKNVPQMAGFPKASQGQWFEGSAEALGRYVVIEVSDSGVGIPDDVLEHIFEPFFSTKPRGKGTGLGLPSALGIVSSHGGFITVATELGKGSAFRVHLPEKPTV